MPKYEIDMTKGSIFKNLIRFAVPLMLTNLLQIFYNAADTVIAGRWEGAHALAAIGATSYLHNMLVNVFVGLSVGAGVVVSKKFGAGNLKDLRKTVHTTVSLGFIMGLVCMILGIVLCRPLLGIMGTPDNVIDLSVTYMRIVFLGIPGAMLYNFCAAILRSVGDTKRPLYILSLSGLLNVLLNIVFVTVFHMGVVGVALATVIANYVSVIVILYVLSCSDGAYRLNIKELCLDRQDVIDIIKIGLPAGLQASMFSLSNTIIQSAVNAIGADAIAGNAAAYSIEYFGYIMIASLHQATLTSIGQNYGAKQEKRIYKTAVISIICGFAIGLFFGVFVTLFARPILGIYITDSEMAIEYGVQRILTGVLPYFICGVMDQISALLIGLGKSVHSAVNTIVGTCVLRFVWVFWIFPLNPTVLWLYACYPISWIIVSVLNSATFLILRKKIMMNMLER